MSHKTIKRGLGKRRLTSPEDIVLADEVRYIQRRAAEREGRFVTIGGIALFSTETGDAWLLDPEDHLALRAALGGKPEDIYFEETGARFAIEWKGSYRIEGDAFVYIDRNSGRVAMFTDYPIGRIAGLG